MIAVSLVFSILLTGFGTYGLAHQVRDLVLALASKRWFIGNAVVIRAEVCERRGPRGRTVFEPTIAFRYAFGDRDYIGHRLAFGDVSSGLRKDSEALTERFAVGTHWEVSICKRRPELAVLHPGPTHAVWYALLFFSGYTTAAIAFLVDTIRRFL